MDADDAPVLPDSWELMRAEERAEKFRQVEVDSARDARVAALLAQSRARPDTAG